eukprot:XP_014021013.1 PREDICTED: sodium channel subunit beta-1-like isoform X3 [Salmo salar]
MRAEVPAEATVEWSFMPKGESEFTKIYSYEDLMSDTPDERFYERLDWKGSKKTKDLQDGSIYILNVTWNDTGTYRCIFTRTLTFSSFKFHNDTTKIVHLNVVPRLTRGIASILSEVMMYVTIVGLQVWLVVEMIYCYRKISAQGEEALRESALKNGSKRQIALDSPSTLLIFTPSSIMTPSHYPIQEDKQPRGLSREQMDEK